MPNVHCRVHNSLPLVPILSQTNSIYNRNTHFNIILYLRLVPNTFQSEKCALPFSLNLSSYAESKNRQDTKLQFSPHCNHSNGHYVLS